MWEKKTTFFKQKKLNITEITHLYDHVQPHVCVSLDLQTHAGAAWSHINAKHT